MADGRQPADARNRELSTVNSEPEGPVRSRDMSYRCAHCGNRTRFDVVETVRRRSYHHFTLGGDLAIEEEEILSREIESVTCRWCDRSDGIEEYSIGTDRNGTSSSAG